MKPTTPTVIDGVIDKLGTGASAKEDLAAVKTELAKTSPDKTTVLLHIDAAIGKLS